MTLQDWFYILGIAVFVSWMVVLIGISVAAFILFRKVQHMQTMAVHRVESIKDSFQNFPLLKISTMGTMLPIVAWLARFAGRKLRRR